MSERLCRNLPILKRLLKAKPGQRRVILHTASDELILALCEVALNILRGTIPLTDVQYKKLRKNKALIKLIADKKVGMRKKRYAINQKGGFLLPLLSIALPFITSLFTSRQS